MRVRAIRDCFIGRIRKEGAEFEYNGPENRNLQPLDGTKWPAKATAAQATKPSVEVDYEKAALLLRSGGYEAETPEAARKFVDGRSKKNRASFLADLAAFEPASHSDEGDASKTDESGSTTTTVDAPGDAEPKPVDGETAK